MFENTRAVFSRDDLETGWVSTKCERSETRLCPFPSTVWSVCGEDMAARVRQAGLAMKVGSVMLYVDNVSNMLS